MEKRYSVFIVIIFLLLSLLFLYAYHQQLKSVYTWQSFIERDEQDELKVVTYNIQVGKGADGKVDLGRTIETLRSLNADIISLQEVERYSLRSYFSDQAKWIAKALDMNLVYYPSITLPGMYYGNVILSRYPIIDYSILSFPSKTENRSAIVAKIKLPSDEIYVVNTHLGLNKKERVEAISEIYETIKELDKPVLVTGDFNSTPIMNEYEVWSHLLTKSNEGIPLQTYSSEDWQIDYIFHSPHFSVMGVAVDASIASDHFPLKGIFRLSSFR